MEFKWMFCATCKTPTIQCPKCKNVTCNGTSGKIDGKDCDVCSEAYEYYTHHEPPEDLKDLPVLDDEKKLLEELGFK